MLTKKAIAIYDKEVNTFIKKFVWSPNILRSPFQFVKQHREWLRNDTFIIVGLDKFEHGYITNGCTEAFNEVYNEKCYVVPGEYTYHVDSNRAIERPFHKIPPGSRLIISYPFASTGMPYEKWDELLEKCKRKNIKVFIDACLSGCSVGSLDLEHPSITHVAFSFSKAFGTGHYRCGVVYTNTTESPASVTNKHLYINHPHVFLHQQIMNTFSSDFIFKKYREQQKKICKKHSLKISDCVIYGLEKGERRCITPELETLLPFQL